MNYKPIVGAVDVGFGEVKHTFGLDAATRRIACKTFPAFAPTADKAKGALMADAPVTNSGSGKSGFSANRTVRIPVGNKVFEVGPDAVNACGGNERGRQRTNDYCLSDEYLALTRGALYYMQQPELDYLVVGLPVTTVDTYRPKLKERLIGSHNCGGFNVRVNNVLVVPQPLGGFYEFGVRNQTFGRMLDETTLVIDLGFCTLDWLVVNGDKPIIKRSGAVHDGGMASVLDRVIGEIQRNCGFSDQDMDSASTINKIDRAMRDGSQIRLFGKDVPYPISHYIEVGQQRLADPLAKLAQTVGSQADIDNIILVGGGSHLISHPVQKLFENHSIKIASDAQTANVRGFQLIGETVAEQARAGA